MKEKLYLDACIFVAYYQKLKEKKRYDSLKKFFEFNQEQDKFDILVSDWTITEMIKVLVREKNCKSKKVLEFAEKLMREKRIFKNKFNMIKAGKDKSYDLEEFFYHIQRDLLKYRGHFADSIHSVIMKNNKISSILTFDEKFNGANDSINILIPII